MRERYTGAGRRTPRYQLVRWGLPLTGALLLASGAGHGAVAHAANSVVGSGTAASCTTNDLSHPNDGPQGLTAAVASGGTVTFDCGGGPVTIKDNLTINKSVTIDGTGQQVTIDGGGTNIVITVNSGVTLAATNLTITNGRGYNGGGIANYGGMVTLTDSTVSKNSALSSGGGIYTTNNGTVGTVTLINSTVSGNSALSGGGIFTYAARVTLTNSTVSNNHATSTASTNNGGGIFNFGAVTLTNSTVSSNSVADTGGGASTNNGGGIANYGTVTLRNTILAGNSGSTDSPDCFGAVTSDDYNLIQHTSGCTIGGTATHDITNQDPQIEALANNGGPTETQALEATSPAVDYVPQANLTVTTDQRGDPRPDTSNNMTETKGDIGAYEVQDPNVLLCTPSCSTSATPELGSGELLATGLLPIGAVLFYRRRRTRRATKQ